MIKGLIFFENSREATLANREYSLSFSGKYKGYSESSWGLSSSVGPGGYKAYGGKPGGGLQDGTIAPYAALSSIVFTPELSVSAARSFTIIIKRALRKLRVQRRFQSG